MPIKFTRKKNSKGSLQTGVYKDKKSNNRWYAQISFNNELIKSSLVNSEKQATNEYKKLCSKYKSFKFQPFNIKNVNSNSNTNIKNTNHKTITNNSKSNSLSIDINDINDDFEDISDIDDEDIDINVNEYDCDDKDNEKINIDENNDEIDVDEDNNEIDIEENNKKSYVENNNDESDIEENNYDDIDEDEDHENNKQKSNPRKRKRTTVELFEPDTEPTYKRKSKKPKVVKVNRKIISKISPRKSFLQVDKDKKLMSQANKCNICSEQLTIDKEFDHIIPRRYEGKDKYINMQYLCGSCHNWKSNHLDTKYIKNIINDKKFNNNFEKIIENIILFQKKEFYDYYLKY